MSNFKTKYDVFKAWMVEDSRLDGIWEMPLIHKPNFDDYENFEFIPFDKLNQKLGFNYWVHFYIFDVYFERIWNNPKQYLKMLKKYKGVISPDFSIYRDMPLAMQVWNTYRNRAIGSWLQNNGIQVVPNVRWGDERSYEFCFSGIERGSVVAVGAHGNIKTYDNRINFENGLIHMIKAIRPEKVIVYGSVCKSINDIFRNNSIDFITVPCETFSYKKEVLS